MNSMTDAKLSPGDTIGILGGGQLGRMIALAAGRLGLKCHVFCPDEASPAFDVSAEKTVAAYDDEKALRDFAGKVDAVTYEFENVPGETADILASLRPVRPGPRALSVSQDRLSEKTFLREASIPVADFESIDSQAGLDDAISRFGGRGVVKTRRFGYDGKGQIMIREEAGATGAFSRLGDVPAILEALVSFEREISVIVARGLDGTARAYDVAENVHENHILKTSSVPAEIRSQTAAQAREIAEKIADALDYVGVMGVEMFLVRSGEEERIIVNEIAPRVHNSGHWTEDACLVSQFEQHVRAVAGWPLGTAERHFDVTMENLIGHDADAWREILNDPGARLHLYGKAETRAGRKMGHVNRLRPIKP
nr:5-(carboxyamino)imidazole ribonucleotide synthase [Hongsoonwoonella zoysiae]